ncbi:MAG: glutamyl-tRNA reductase [Proteobacteria bacterium]|nr:glutamyl-tRNA reductase [Burkholderiales bacterium]
MQLYAVGINHQSAPIKVRERVAFDAETMGGALRSLVETGGPIREAAILSTCNRTEIYCSTNDPQFASGWLADYHKLERDTLTPYLYTLPSEAAARHAFRVGSGLDSMVLGEPQILGQLKQAVRSAEHAGTLGSLLHKLFQRTFSIAKKVRSETEIGASSVSMAAAAVGLAERLFPSVSEQRVLFVGAGEMIELCAAHFCARKPRTVSFANRTQARGQLLAARHGGSAMSLADLPDRLPDYDIVVTCTASQLPIIGKGLLERTLKARRRKPVFIVDLAVPRDVEAEAATMDDVFLYTVDDLGEIAKQGRDARAGAVEDAEAIISLGVSDFMNWVSARDLVPAIRTLRDEAERARQREVEQALRRLTLGDDAGQVIERLSRSLTNKLLHAPSHALNNLGECSRDELVQLLSGRPRTSDRS